MMRTSIVGLVALTCFAACSSAANDGNGGLIDPGTDDSGAHVPDAGKGSAHDSGTTGHPGSDAGAQGDDDDDDAGSSTSDSGPATGNDASPGVDAGPSNGTHWQPKPGTSWQWQLSGTLDTSLAVQMYDIDLFDNSKAVISGLQAKGIKVICYVDAGSYEPGRPDSASFTAAVLGKVMDGWPDEKWLDIRSTVVRDLIGKRFDVAVQKGCDGVEPDNVDGYTNDTGFPLTAADQLDYNRFLANAAHTRNLSVALKNDPDQVKDLVNDFDFELDEQCFQYSECDSLLPFINAGKAVFEVEYGNASPATICPKAIADNFDTLIKDLDLTAKRTSCR